MTGHEPAVEAAERGPQTGGPAPQAAEPAPQDDAQLIDDEPQPMVIRKRGRRVSTEPTPGYLGEPAIERHQSSENDARLKGDVPPHWG